jgi:myosin-3
MAEGIPVDVVEFSDNRPILDMLLSRPMGLLALLDEESRFPCSTERSLIGKIQYECTDFKLFLSNRN